MARSNGMDGQRKRHQPWVRVPALAGMMVLFAIALPVIAADLALPLPNVDIPPIKGKTATFDIMEIDQATHLLYLGDRGTVGVDIFDISTPSARYLQTIPTGATPNGVSLAKNVNKVFVGLTDSSIGIIDIDPASPTRNTVIAKLPSGGKKRVDEMDYDPKEKKLYAANSDDGLVTVVDAVGNAIVKQFKDLGEGLEQPRYNAGDGMMYMTSSDQNAIFQFDPRRDALVRKYDVGIGCNPNGLAINPATNQALLGCSNAKNPMAVLWDLKGGGVITTFNQVGGGDMAFFAPKANLFFFAASNFPPGPVIAIFGGTPVHWIGNIPTARGSHMVAFDETHHMIYTAIQLEGQAGLMRFWLPQIPQ